MMDGTIREEINPEARVPGEWGAVSIFEMLNERAGCNRQQQIHLPPAPLMPQTPRSTPGLALLQVFIKSEMVSAEVVQ